MSDDIEDFRDAFSLFDKMGDGKIECSEIGDLLRALGLNPTESTVKKIVSEIDSTGTKRISLEEFVPLFHMQAKQKPPASDSSIESFQEAFRIFDRDSNGNVSVAEIRHLLTSLGETLNSSDVDHLVAGLEDENGNLNYEEFVKGVMSG